MVKRRTFVNKYEEELDSLMDYNELYAKIVNDKLKEYVNELVNKVNDGIDYSDIMLVFFMDFGTLQQFNLINKLNTYDYNSLLGYYDQNIDMLKDSIKNGSKFGNYTLGNLYVNQYNGECITYLNKAIEYGIFDAYYYLYEYYKYNDINLAVINLYHYNNHHGYNVEVSIDVKKYIEINKLNI